MCVDDRDWPVNSKASNYVALLLIWRLHAGDEAVFIVLPVQCCWIVCVMCVCGAADGHRKCLCPPH